MDKDMYGKDFVEAVFKEIESKPDVYDKIVNCKHCNSHYVFGIFDSIVVLFRRSHYRKLFITLIALEGHKRYRNEYGSFYVRYPFNIMFLFAQKCTRMRLRRKGLL
jgi:hypothetical protein